MVVRFKTLQRTYDKRTKPRRCQLARLGHVASNNVLRSEIVMHDVRSRGELFVVIRN